MKRDGKFYNKNEKAVMQSLNLIPTLQSGAGWLQKEDGYNDKVVAQLKSTDANSYRLELLDWQKLLYHANTEHKAPLFVIEFLQASETLLVMRKQDIKNIALSLLGVDTLEELQYDNSAVEIEPQEQIKAVAIKSSKKSREQFYKEREQAWSNKNKRKN